MDSNFVQNIYHKAIQLKEKITIFNKQNPASFIKNIPQITKSTNDIVITIANNLEYLNNQNIIFYDDFNNAIHLINFAFDLFLKPLNSTQTPNSISNLASLLDFEFENFSKTFFFFSNALQAIFINSSNFSNMTKNEIGQINKRLGLECVLLSLSFNIKQINEWPYFESKYLQVYQHIDQIKKVPKKITGIQSFYGTGKTTCIPIASIIQSLKNKNNCPICLLIEADEMKVEMKKTFFESKLSKYATIISDPNMIIEMSKTIQNKQNEDKIVFGILTQYNLLYIVQKIGNYQQFYVNTKIIIDDVFQRTVFLDVLIAKFISININQNISHIDLDVTLISSLFTPKFMEQYDNDIEFISLIKNQPFKVTESPVINSTNSKTNNNEVVLNETQKIINKMSEVCSNINKGHILCFLSDFNKCQKLKDSIINNFRNDNESIRKQKIIILQTTLKQNENIDSYFKRLHNELELKESLKEGKKYQFEFLYFIPLVLIGNENELIFKLAQNEFPSEFNKIYKLIITTPEFQSSLDINHLSVCIDNGLEEEKGFDISTDLKTLNETNCTWESYIERKGRLGRTMNGLYIPILPSNSYEPYYKLSDIENHDLSTDILILKNIGIDLEKLGNLPYFDNTILKYSIKNLISLGAIDSRSNKIKPFGQYLLKFSYIPLFYTAAAIKFKDQFGSESKQQMYFISLYILTIISIDSILVKNDLTDKLSKHFRDDSDIVTLINALNSLLVSKITDENEMKLLVESYGFSYQAFIQFKEYMQLITNETFPGKQTQEVIYSIGGFLKKQNGISSIIDKFIFAINSNYPNWKNIHLVDFKCMSGSGSYESVPTIVYIGSNKLRFVNQPRYRPNGGLRLFTRPGWNGVVVPNECYCFNIYRKIDSIINVGRLIHRKSQYSQKAIISLESDKIILNPWFDVLISTYFENEHRNFIHFYNNSNENKSESQPAEKKIFHYSKIEERVFISFIPRKYSVIEMVTNAIKDCLQLMPFTPRSVLIFRNDIHSLVEVTSIGAEHYETSNAISLHGSKLQSYHIHYCLKNINELAKSNSSIRLCSLFINDQCRLIDYDQKNLYIICNNDESLLINEAQSRYYELYRYADNLIMNDDTYYQGLDLFQFPTKFIHPALLLHQESFDIIMKWFSNYCNYAKVVKVIGSRFLMKPSDIFNLYQHLRHDKQQIQEQMKLNYVAIPIPKKINEKNYLLIQSNPKWNIIDKFHCIVTTKDEEEKVKDFLEKANEDQDDMEETLCCLYACDDPENPTLTNYSITIYHQDGKTYTNKMCRECLVSSLQIATDSFYSNGQIDKNALAKINFKPSVIPSVQSKETNDGLQCWPQIPLGQMISALINNDYEMSSLVSAWLNSVNEYSIRTQFKNLYTFCPEHPQRILRLRQNDINNFSCSVDHCENCYCEFCNSWHPKKYICDEMKDETKTAWKKMCPRCKIPTFKDTGCNHITCPCGCHWCYKCGEGFNTPTECYDHLSRVHGGCFDYHFDD